MDFLLILEKGFFAAIAALGFAAVGNPSKAAFRYVPMIAFCGNALRFTLMTYAGMNIAIATFFAAVFAGFIAVGFAYHARYPIEVFAFPALLPMIPGQFAYRSILGTIRFMESTQEVGAGAVSAGHHLKYDHGTADDVRPRCGRRHPAIHVLQGLLPHDARRGEVVRRHGFSEGLLHSPI